MRMKSNRNNENRAESAPEAGLRQQIEKRAYHIWLSAGGLHGDDLSHWLQAESEVLTELAKTSQHQKS
jgi:hypothetical protein